MKSKGNNKKDLSQRLQFLKKVLRIIENGGTGFDLAYEIEKNKEINNFLHDGILFYNVFIEIGNKSKKHLLDGFALLRQNCRVQIQKNGKEDRENCNPFANSPCRTQIR